VVIDTAKGRRPPLGVWFHQGFLLVNEKMIKKKDRKPRHEDLAKRKVWDNKLMLLVYTGPKKERNQPHTGAPSNKVKKRRKGELMAAIDIITTPFLCVSSRSKGKNLTLCR
jgi:hypothetical protein